jgi:hypothetical protein
MTARHLPFRRWPALVAALLGLHACTTDDNMAGGSSEVDNPQILMAFVDSAGAPKYTTGSLGIFLSDQSPALNPAPVVEIRLAAAAIRLTPAHLALAGLTDSTRSFNLYLRGDDSTGAFLQKLLYNPAAKKFTHTDGSPVTELNFVLSPLVRSESVLGSGGDTTGINRLLIPGSPFVAVLVDSVFVFEEIPAGVYPVHILAPNGVELPLEMPLDTRAPGQHHQVNTDTQPVVRPPPPPGPMLRALAGEDHTTNLGAAFFLNGEVEGLQGSQGPMVLWRQLPPAHPDARAVIKHPTKLKSKVDFPRPGAYGFVLSVAYQNVHAEDTVWIGVLASTENPVFIEPSAEDTAVVGRPYRIIWVGHREETVDLELSRDGGMTWEIPPIAAAILSRSGFNERIWVPSGSPSSSCRLRLRRGEMEVARSPAFSLKEGYMNMPASIWKPGFGGGEQGYHPPDHD